MTNVLQTLRKVDGKTKGHRMAMMDLLTMFSPKEIERAYKANKRGFTNLMNMMYPRNKDALTISDLTVDGQFMAKTGRLLSRDQTKQLGNPLDKIKESDDEDIPPHTDIQEKQFAIKGAGQEFSKRDRARRRKASSCLLYTSDAADE